MAKHKGGYGFLIKWLIGTGDLIILNLIFLLICELTQIHGLSDFNFKIKIMLFMLNFSYFFAVYFIPVKIYKPVIYTDKIIQRSLSLIAMHAIIFITCLSFFRLDMGQFPIRFVIYLYAALFFIFALWRVFAREALKQYRSIGRNYVRVIIVGAGKNGLNLYSEMKKNNTYGFQVCGFFDDNLTLKNTLSNYLGMTHEVEEYIKENRIDEIYCTLPNSQDEKIMRIFNFAEKNMIRFYIVPEFSRYVKKRLQLESIESLPVMAVRTEPLQTIHNQIIK